MSLADFPSYRYPDFIILVMSLFSMTVSAYQIFFTFDWWLSVLLLWTSVCIVNMVIHGLFLEITVTVGYLRFPIPNKTDRHDITEILLKETLNTITLYL